MNIKNIVLKVFTAAFVLIAIITTGAIIFVHPGSQTNAGVDTSNSSFLSVTNHTGENKNNFSHSNLENEWSKVTEHALFANETSPMSSVSMNSTFSGEGTTEQASNNTKPEKRPRNNKTKLTTIKPRR